MVVKSNYLPFMVPFGLKKISFSMMATTRIDWVGHMGQSELHLRWVGLAMHFGSIG